MHSGRQLGPLLAGSLFCGVSAAIVVAVAPASGWVPVAFVVVLLAASQLFGSRAGIVGSLIAAIVFAVWLYAPIGSVEVNNPEARMNLGWMILAGISLSFLFASPAHPGDKQHRP